MVKKKAVTMRMRAGRLMGGLVGNEVAIMFLSVFSRKKDAVTC